MDSKMSWVISRSTKSLFFDHQELLRESAERVAAQQEEHRASLTTALKEQEVRWLHLDASCTDRVLTVAPDASEGAGAGEDQAAQGSASGAEGQTWGPKSGDGHVSRTKHFCF